jgi:chemotaxis protein MotB
MTRKPEPPAHHADERWVISYADLVTLLLGFFIILFAAAKVDQDKLHELSFAFKQAFNVDVREGDEGSSPAFKGGLGIVPGANTAQIPEPDIRQIRAIVDEQLTVDGLSSSAVDVIRDGQGVVIRVSDRLLFASASAELNPEAKPLLRAVAGVLKGLGSDVRVEGHTDNVPVLGERYPTNWELSSARATTVLRFLIEEGSLDARRMVAAGYAEFRPIASNTTPEGRAINRRADIVLVATPTAKGSIPAVTPQIAPVTSGSSSPKGGAGH